MNIPNPLGISKFTSYINGSIDTAITTYAIHGDVPKEFVEMAHKFRDSLVMAHAEWLKKACRATT